MPKRRGPKSKGRGTKSDYYRGYHCGWARVEKGITKKQIQISKRSKEYQRGYRAGVAAAKRCYK